MPFQFSLHSVLHLRKSLEHQQELRLRTANQRVAHVRHVLEQLEGRRQLLYTGQTKHLTDGITSAELRFQLQCDQTILRQRREVEQQLGILEKARDQQRDLFQQARRGRETLEILRDQQQEVYTKEAARQGQRRQDDLYLMRFLLRR